MQHVWILITVSGAWLPEVHGHQEPGGERVKELYIGPYTIVDYVSPVNVLLKDCKTGKHLPRSVHINKLKKYLPAQHVDGKLDGCKLHDDQLPVGLPQSTSADDSDTSPDMAETPISDTEADIPDSTSDDVTSDGITLQEEVHITKDDSTPSDVDTDSDLPTMTLPDQTNSATNSDDQMYPVKSITGVRTGLDGYEQYRVSFKNCPKKYNRWISIKDMSPALQAKAESRKLPRSKPEKLRV